jgi:hypothetical protein
MKSSFTVAVNCKGHRREQGTEAREGGIGIEHALLGSVRISRRDTIHENLGLVEIEGEASVLLKYTYTPCVRIPKLRLVFVWTI